MSKTKVLVAFLVLVSMPVVMFADFREHMDRIELGVSAGVGFYVGQENPLAGGKLERVQSYNAVAFGDKNTLKWPGIETFGFEAGYRFDMRWHLQLKTVRQRVNFVEQYEGVRALYYNAMWHVDAMAEFNILRYGNKMTPEQGVYNVVPYVGLGLGVTMYNQNATLRAVNVNSGTSYSGCYFRLDNDIDLNNINWTPIGNGSAFSGTFEGNGKTISGLKVNASGTYAGLFGQVSGTIKNLTVTGSVTLNYSSSSATSVYAGILAGNVSGWLATIDSCSTSGDVTVTSNCTASFAFTSANVYAGGVIGNNSSFIGSEILSHKSGTVTASYTGSKATGNVYAGGIAGKTSGSLTDCYNKGDVKASTSKGSSYAGGLAGQCAATETSYNTGAITAGTYCGAIAGYATGSSTNCYYETGSASQAFGGSGMGSSPTATAKKASDMTNKKFDVVLKYTPNVTSANTGIAPA